MSKDHTNQVSCPKCGWQPDGQAHWKCKCGNTWDMFSTGGRCPDCLRQWEKTRCPTQAGGCNTWSPHLEWYGDLQGWLVEELRYLPEITTQRKDQ